MAIVAVLTTPALAAEPSPESSTDASCSGVSVGYDDGLNIESCDGNYRWHLELRSQLRYTNADDIGIPAADDVVSEGDGFEIRRARLKLGGHAYRPWLQFYTEFDFPSSNLLDLHFTLERSDALALRAGQYKIFYNRERVDSSGRQQLVERSIVTRPFTLDRQQGLMLHGRLFAGRPGDSRYALGIFTGTGRGGSLDDDGRPMYLGRWQWNFLRRDLEFSESDIERHEKPAATFSVAAVSNRSRFTRFSSSGGGQLDGFAEGESGQYDVEQAMAEVALMSDGLSLQGEFHWKRIDDRVNDTRSELTGYYTALGYFFSEICRKFPRPLELALRYARVDPDDDLLEPKTKEFTIGANWFFYGHRNKLTIDVSRLELDTPVTPEETTTRTRLQWDVSF